MPTAELVVHGTKTSGHTHKVVSFLHLLKLPFRFVEVPAAKRGTPEFVALNPFAQVPVLQDGALTIADSNAILVYLARRYAPDSAWLPQEPTAAAEVQRWFSISAGEIASGPGLARLGTLWPRDVDLPRARAVAERLLRFMHHHLETRDWLAASTPTLADIACYPYVARAPEGGIDLTPYSSVEKWIVRVEALEGFVAMPHTQPVGR
jgi:glutathione S-transferase